jgi:hypothetical protein
MRHASPFHPRSDRGFYLIGLIFVVAIIMILAGRNYRGASGTGGTGNSAGSGGVESLFIAPLEMQATEINAGNARLENTRDQICDTNRTQLGIDLSMLSINYAGQMPDPSIVKQHAGHLRCTSPKGALQYDADGNVYCTLHAPAPGGIRVFDL